MRYFFNSFQLTVITRYVNTTCEPLVRFLTFIQIFSHTCQNLADTLLQYLSELNIDFDFAHCRGQAYDNASNDVDTMAYTYNCDDRSQV